MPPFRLPFTNKKTNGLGVFTDENTQPNSNGNDTSNPIKERPSLALGKKEVGQEPNEFKLSSVSDNGQYLPPSPTEKKSFWSKTPSNSTTKSRPLLDENEPFSISRESFDSYRRSFDISGRSPVTQSTSFNSRASFDSRPSRLPPPRLSLNENTFQQPPEHEAFEDVKLNEDQANKQQPKKKGFLSRLTESDTTNASADGKSHHFHIPGRKRGQSGTGNELGDINRPSSKGKAEVVVR